MSAGGRDRASAPVDGVSVPHAELVRRWHPWTPGDVRDRLAGIDAPWGVAAGWAIDLFLGTTTRAHGDIEITVPAASFPAVADALAEFDWDVVGSGRIWPYPSALDRFHQTWLRDRATGQYLLDVFREPHDGTTWLCRRDPAITLPYDLVYARSDDGIPYVIPEIVLLFKAPHLHPKDQADFDHVLPLLPPDRRRRLVTWLERVQPDHRWLAALGAR